MGTTRPGTWGLYQPSLADLVKPASNDFPKMLKSVEDALGLERSLAASDTAAVVDTVTTANGLVDGTTGNVDATGQVVNAPGITWAPTISPGRHLLPEIRLDDNARHPDQVRRSWARRGQWFDYWDAQGDSITRSMDSAGLSNTVAFSQLAAGALSLHTTNRGVSGWSATELGILYGAILLEFTTPSGTIGTSPTPITVAPFPSACSTNERTWPGTIRDDAGTWRHVTITRTGAEPGTWTATANDGQGTITTTRPVKFVPDGYNPAAPAITMWGRNQVQGLDAFKYAHQAMARLKDRHGAPWFVMTVTNAVNEPSGSAGYAQVKALNDALYELFPMPGQILDIRSWLIKYGLAVRGITPTADDTLAISEDRIPKSLMQHPEGPTDVYHPNDEGQRAIAVAVADHIAYLMG